MIQRGLRRPDRHVRRRLAHCRHPSQIPRISVYNDLPVITIDTDAILAMETQRQADILFEKLRGTTVFKASKVEDKREYLRYVLHALKRALYHRGCVIYPRRKSHPEFSKVRLQVIEALIELDLVFEHRSPKGSPKMSRLLPMPELKKYADSDPWKFVPNVKRQVVYLVDRETRQELPIDRELPVVADTERCLDLVNRVNDQHEIIYTPFSEWECDFVGRRRLRPFHFAKFTDHWNWHGRIYTGQYGHQSLRKIERRTIEFNETQSVELDYSGMHPRMLYHLEGIDFHDDPYALWGACTNGPQRVLAKKLVNAALNSTIRKAAINACNQARSIYGTEGERKSGKALADAIKLDSAYRKTGMTFGEIFDLATRNHDQIAKYFGSDAGMWLMRLDSAIAMKVLYHFAKRCIPCLACHDSFIVPQIHAQELREVMSHSYHKKLGYLPVVKG